MTKELLEYFNGDELAASVWQSKYQQEGDITPDDMHKRMAKEFAKVELDYQEDENALGDTLQKTEAEKFLSEYGRKRQNLNTDSIYNLFKNFKYIIPQGSVMATLGTAKVSSLSNCFFNGYMEDNINSIYDVTKSMAEIGKMRGGTSTDLSHLRPKGAEIDNSAQESAGAASFLSLLDTTGKIIGQKGRKMAMMVTMDINHPDILDFIKIKRDLTKVTNANLSIKLNNDFMKAVENDEDYILRFPCDADIKNRSKDILELPYNELFTYGIYDKTENKTIYWKKIKAKEYWNEIVKSAHGVAEPGLLFWDNVLDYSPDSVYDKYRPEGTNPCSEITLSKLDSCRLLVTNLYSFVDNPFTEKASFNFEKFYEVNYEAQRLADDLVDLELEYVQRIIDKAEKSGVKDEVELWKEVYKIGKAGRRTGVGFTALADTLAALGFKYDSEEAVSMIERIMRIKMESELDCTTDLAILRGTFEGWNNELEFVIKSLWDENGYQIKYAEGRNKWYSFISYEYPEQAKRMYKYGRRNVSFSTVAPTGSVSLLTQTTSGIEPLFQPYYIRRRKIDGTKEKADFIDENGEKWKEFAVLHPKFKDWIKSSISYESKDFSEEQLNELFEKSPWFKSTANDIDWNKRVKIQSIIQKYITHSISSTINLPKDVSIEEVSDIYLNSWKKGLKGITVYRDGSRSGVLVNASTKSDKKDNVGFKQYNAPKRPKELKADYYFTTSRGRKYAVIVGLLEDKPYEVFAFEDPLEEKHLHGKIIKIKKGVYKFVSDKYVIDNLQLSSEHSDEKLLTRWISLALRHGANPKYIVEQTEKSELGITAFPKVVARVLKKYISNGEKSTITCPVCGSSNVVFQEGCSICQDCGASACG